MNKLSEEAKGRLHKDLVKLGDMMGDGLHLESDGKWISREYKKILKALGMLPKKKISPEEMAKRKSKSEAINKRMQERISQTPCGKCNGALKQTRIGSKRAICESCGGKWQLLR